MSQSEIQHPKSILNAEAYWISPNGHIFPVVTRHIHAVINQPGQFGLTTRYVRSVYHKYREPIGMEGKARREIMERLLRSGWIRIRYKLRPTGWYIECSDLDKTKSLIVRWTKTMLDSDYSNPNDAIYLSSLPQRYWNYRWKRQLQPLNADSQVPCSRHNPGIETAQSRHHLTSPDIFRVHA